MKAEKPVVAFFEQLTKILIYVSIFLIPFYFFRFEAGSSLLKTNIFEVGVFLSLLSLAIYLIAAKKRPIFGDLWPYLFLFLALLAIIFSDDKTKAIGIFKGWFLVPAILYFVIINTFHKLSTKWLLIPLSFSVLVVSLWAIAQRYGIIVTAFYQVGDSSFSQYLLEKRSFGPFESPNYLAMFLTPCLFLLALLWQKVSKIGKITLSIAILLSLWAIYLSGSRAGEIAVLVTSLALVLGIIFRKFRCSRSLEWFTAAIVALGAGVLTWLFAFASHNDSYRLEIWKYSWQIVKTHPIFGLGLTGFQDQVQSLSLGNQDFIYYGLPYALHPHNLFLAIWINLGILGLLCFLIILYKFFRQNIRSNQLILVLAMSAILIHGLFDTTYFKNDLSAIFWLILALSFLQAKKAEVKS